MTGLEAKFSMEYCVAAALTKGSLGIVNFIDANVSDPDVRPLIGKVHLISESKMDKVKQEKKVLAPTRVKVFLKDGRILEETVYEARGGVKEPLSWDDLESKFQECTNDILSEGQRENIVGIIKNMDDLDDINVLTACLRQK
jgi:2-methylcitrate dehydratase PrpD